MTCSNCYNGCSDGITSDQCVKYSGVDVPILGIKTGDSLSYVEQALIAFLVSTLDGTGIKIDIPEEVLCDLVTQYLPTCGDITAVDLFIALIKSACDLQNQIDAINLILTTLEGPYDIGCLSGVDADSGTHNILQATITKVCEVEVALAALALDLSTNYVRLDELDTLIQIYLTTLSDSTKLYNKMIPYTAVEYYGSLANFDITGAGIGDWEKIYLCNGLNGTPDKRGRVGVGAIAGVGGGALNPNVDPLYTGNPNYALNTQYGVNFVTLSTNQIPAHTHNNTLNFNDPGHDHDITATDYNGTAGSGYVPAAQLDGLESGGTVDSNTTGITCTLTNASAGGGLSHNNVQPSLGCYYIIYIP